MTLAELHITNRTKLSFISTPSEAIFIIIYLITDVTLSKTVHKQIYTRVPLSLSRSTGYSIKDLTCDVSLISNVNPPVTPSFPRLRYSADAVSSLRIFRMNDLCGVYIKCRNVQYGAGEVGYGGFGNVYLGN